MVKQLDDKSSGAIEHLGLDLWRAALAWRERLHREMVLRGHDWYGDARGTVAQSLDLAGLSQSELVARMGITKQAVQQLVDRLEADGIVRRVDDPADRRSKRVEYTAEGLRAVRDANAIKRRMDRDLIARLGVDGVAALRNALGAATEALASADEIGPRRR